MTRRSSLSELVWPDTPDDRELAVQWANESVYRILDWTWRSFDQLVSNVISSVDLSQPLEQLERDIVRLHFIELQCLFSQETDGFPSFVPHHEWPEMESRTSPSAKPPSYDIAFVSLANRRWAWPIEAKVIPTPGTLAEYLKDVNEKFVGEVASPLIGNGAMIGYLLTGERSVFFQNLQAALNQTLQEVAEFVDRAHKTSSHTRTHSPDLILHHLAMDCSS